MSGLISKGAKGLGKLAGTLSDDAARAAALTRAASAGKAAGKAAASRLRSSIGTAAKTTVARQKATQIAATFTPKSKVTFLQAAKAGPTETSKFLLGKVKAGIKAGGRGFQKLSIKQKAAIIAGTGTLGTFAGYMAFTGKSFEEAAEDIGEAAGNLIGAVASELAGGAFSFLDAAGEASGFKDFFKKFWWIILIIGIIIIVAFLAYLANSFGLFK